MTRLRLLLLLILAAPAVAQESVEDTSGNSSETAETAADGSEATAEDDDQAPNGDGIEAPKAMSGMSILGNEEAPKSLVIIPWKSSELGEDITLDDSLDDRARPVDKEVFLRELNFYEIRTAEQ